MPSGGYVSTLATLTWPSQRTILFQQHPQKTRKKNNKRDSSSALPPAPYSLVTFNLVTCCLKATCSEAVCLEGATT